MYSYEHQQYNPSSTFINPALLSLPVGGQSSTVCTLPFCLASRLIYSPRRSRRSTRGPPPPWKSETRTSLDKFHSDVFLCTSRISFPPLRIFVSPCVVALDLRCRTSSTATRDSTTPEPPLSNTQATEAQYGGYMYFPFRIIVIIHV